jgi:hypothetical protein
MAREIRPSRLLCCKKFDNVVMTTNGSSSQWIGKDGAENGKRELL